MLFLNAILSADVICKMFENMPLLTCSLAMLESLRAELERSRQCLKEALELGLSGSMKGHEEQTIAKYDKSARLLSLVSAKQLSNSACVAHDARCSLIVSEDALLCGISTSDKERIGDLCVSGFHPQRVFLQSTRSCAFLSQQAVLLKALSLACVSLCTAIHMRAEDYALLIPPGDCFKRRYPCRVHRAKARKGSRAAESEM